MNTFNLAKEDLPSENAPLFEGALGLNSLAAITLLVTIEERFNISVDDEDLLVENFSTIEQLVNLAKKLL